MPHRLSFLTVLRNERLTDVGGRLIKEILQRRRADARQTRPTREIR
jgi:hypothetical protein